MSTTMRLDADGVEVDSADPRQSNAIRTTRFTLLTWLPKSLYLQLHRLANIYFIIIAVLACTPWWPGKWQSKVGTVSAILLAQAAKDAYEDLKRKWDDERENARPFRRFDSTTGCFDERAWQDCAVGDVVLIENGADVPADLLVVASADGSGACYMSTKSLDGETNLKQRRAPAILQRLSGQGDAATAAAAALDVGLTIELEEPTADLAKISCSLSIGDAAEDCGLSSANFALRGCRLQNTEWMLGVACYIGDDTKVILNSAEAPSKVSELEHTLNKCVLTILAFIFGTSLLFAITSAALFDGTFHVVFVRYLIIFYAVLPMTLYIMFEIMKSAIGLQIESDELMHDEDSGAYASARNTAVVEELGQINFVFSDKTGTLTANEMRFAFCCVADTTIGPFVTSEGTTAAAPGFKRARAMLMGGPLQRETKVFFECLAACNTVKVGENCVYQGESPDEVALADAAKTVGIALQNSEPFGDGFLHVVDSLGQLERFNVAHVLEFSSDRKRMSVVCPMDNGGAVVMTKGADTVMLGLLNAPISYHAQAALDGFAREGLRTLVVARRFMDPSAYASWKMQWDRASAALNGRDEQVAAVAAAAEVGLSYVGITALEDRLQERVPHTIENLREAGIRVWVLTGDKVETAVEIAKSCRLFEAGMPLHYITGKSSASEVSDALGRALDDVGASKGSKGLPSGMVLDGDSVACVLEDDESQELLYNLASLASSCVCCRLSPLQKRQLVELVRERNSAAITLSIGDGANDVPMIQGAHIGIGIRGKEGAASVRASDFAVSQFKFLGNLVFCHGRKAYRRIATFLCYFIYKSVVLGWGYMIYAMTIGFTGILGYSEWLDITYNPLTSAAVVVLLVCDVDFDDEHALEDPPLYRPGPERAYLNPKQFGKWMAYACWHGIISWSVPLYLLCSVEDQKARSSAFWQASFTAFSIVILVIHLKLLLVAVKPISSVGVAAVILELAAFVVVAAVLSSSLCASFAPEMQGMLWTVASSPKHLACIILVSCLALTVDVISMVFATPCSTSAYCTNYDGISDTSSACDGSHV